MSETRSSAAGVKRLKRGGGRPPEVGDDARRRAAVELIARHESALKRTARRFSLDNEDADDAYQRALEIVLTKAPTTDPTELIRWTLTVTKHEALALRRSRERLLGKGGDGTGRDPIASLASDGDGPGERVERQEDVARSREALRALKPAELRALGLLAEGYSYAEIGEITGFSQTKVNRLLAEGRSRFRDLVSRGEDGTRCRELRPLLSAFCDGETSPAEGTTVREHLRACAHCRATMRAYRRAPGIAAALAPALPASTSLLGRVRDLLDGLASRLPGPGADSAAQGVAIGGVGTTGMTGVAKLLVVCAAATGGTAACVATGVVPAPLDLNGVAPPPIERAGEGPASPPPVESVRTAPPPRPTTARTARPPAKKAGEAEAPTGGLGHEAPPAEAPPAAVPEAPVAASEPAAVSTEPTASPTSAGSAAGEFGP